MNSHIWNIFILQLFTFSNYTHALPTAPVDVSVIEDKSTNGSKLRYFVSRKFNSTGHDNLKSLDSLGDISKLFSDLEIKEAMNQDPGREKNQVDKYKIYMKRKIKTFKNPRKTEEDRMENATRTFLQSNQNQSDYLPTSKSNVYNKISIGEPVIVYKYSTSKNVSSSPYDIRTSKRYEKHESETNLERTGENGEVSRVALEDAKWTLNENEPDETHLLNNNEGNSSMKTEVYDVQIPTEVQDITEEVNINGNINEDFEKLNAKSHPYIETYSSSKDKKSSLRQDNNMLPDRLLIAENNKTLLSDSFENEVYMQSNIDHTLETKILLLPTNDSQNSFDSYLSGQLPDSLENKLKNISYEKELVELNASNDEIKLSQNEHNNIINNTHKTDSPSDPIVLKQTNNVEAALFNEEQNFIPNDKLDEEQTDIAFGVNDELKPVLRNSSNIDEKYLQQQEHADSGPTRKIRIKWIKSPSNQIVLENTNILNGNVGLKKTTIFFNRNGTQKFSANIHHGQSQKVTGSIGNGETKWKWSSTQIFDHPEVLKTQHDKTSTCNVGQGESFNNFVNQGVAEVSSASTDQKQTHTECADLSSTQTFKENTNALNLNVKPEQTQIISAHIKDECSQCGDNPQEQSSQNLTGQDIVEEFSDIQQEQSHAASVPFDNVNTEWLDMHSNKLVKDHTKYPFRQISYEQKQIYPNHVNQETNLPPETSNTENIHNIKVDDYETDTKLESRKKYLLNNDLFALTNLRELLIMLEMRLKTDHNIQLSNFYTMIKLIYLVLKSQVTEDNSIWFKQLQPEVRHHLIRYVNILIRRRWVQQLMLYLNNNSYNLEILKRTELTSLLNSWHNDLNYDLMKNLDKSVIEGDVLQQNTGLFTFTRPYVRPQRVYYFIKPGPQQFPTIFRNLQTRF